MYGHYLQDWMTGERLFRRSDPAKGEFCTWRHRFTLVRLAEHVSGLKIHSAADLTTVIPVATPLVLLKLLKEVLEARTSEGAQEDLANAA